MSARGNNIFPNIWKQERLWWMPDQSTAAPNDQPRLWKAGSGPEVSEDLPLSHSALRSPLTLSSPFTTSFSLSSHSALNGDLSVPSSYVSLHLSPQVSGSVVYGRSPMVSPWRGGTRRYQQGAGAGGQDEKPLT